MDHDLHNMNQFLGDHDSFHFPASTQDRTIRKSSLQIKQPQLLISPGHNAFAHRVFAINSPSPFKQNINFFEQDQSFSQDNHENYEINDSRRRCINQVLNFQQSPKKKTGQNSTASSLRSTNRTPQISSFSLHNRDQKKNTKGLRNLSQSVYKIVLDLKVTTYKQVADQLIRMLNQGQFGPLEEQATKAKDQQNIKRRVYDALNVLISADVLKKNGKFVISDQDVISDRLKGTTKLGKKEDSENLYEQIIKREKIIQEKKAKIEQLRNKKQILNAILKRNKKKKGLQKQKIPFPIIGITYKKNIPKLNLNQTRTKVVVPLTNTVEIIGDMDLLVKVGIDVLSQNIEQIIEEVSEQDLQYDLPRKKKAKDEASTKNNVPIQSSTNLQIKTSKVPSSNNSNNNIGQSRQKSSRVLYAL